MSATLTALVPVFGLIAIGCALKQLVFKSPSFWDPIEKLTYWVLFPALLVASMAQARVAGPTIVPAAAVLAAVTVTLLALLTGIRPLLRIDGPAYSAVVQGAIRFNTYVGLAAAAALHGRQGTALLAILLALMVPLSNVVSVIALTRHAGGDSSWRGLLVELASNPLILASIVGLSLSMTHAALPALVTTMLDALGRAALSLGLLAVGAGLSLGALTANSTAVATSVVLKLIVYPLLAALGCDLLDLEPLARGRHSVRRAPARALGVCPDTPPRRRSCPHGRHHHHPYDPGRAQRAARAGAIELTIPTGRTSTGMAASFA